MIKAVIFDVGGVLIRTEDRTGRQAWEERLGLAEYGLSAVVFDSEMGRQAQAGLVSTADLWQWIGRHLDFDAAALDQFQRDFWAGDVLDVELMALVRRLRPRYQTAIISNATDALREALTDHWRIADAFDLIVCSAEEKVMKPDPEIFRRTLARLHCQPAEALFVDDFEHNIRAAADLGLHTIHFRPGLNVAAELEGLGVKRET